MLKILMIDDHLLFREGITYLLAEIDDQIDLLHASHCEEAFRILDESPQLELTLDLVLLDLSLPGMDGVQGLKQLQERLRTVPVVVLSATENSSKIQFVIDEGAQGFIPKSASSGLMISAIKIVLEGGSYVPDNLLNRQEHPGGEPIHRLSGREREVLTLIGRGFPNKTIARELDIAENTVRVHVAAILRKLGVKNRTEAARLVLNSDRFDS